jgi:hypothetical protein
MGSVDFHDPDHIIVMKSTHDPGSQTKGLRLEKDILPNMTGLDHSIPFSSGTVFARNPAIF